MPHEQCARSIDISDTPLSSGAQGKIYEVSRVDGSPISSLLVKLFDSSLPITLREIVSAVAKNLSSFQIDQCITLQALPLFLFKGGLSGRAVEGYVMRRVGGKPFNEVLDQDLNWYINLPLPERLTFALQFAEGMKILYCLTIVHADVNGQNLMIDFQNHRLAIIDLDGGAVAKSGSTPIVIGKPEPGWLDPQILEQLASTTRQQTVDVNITADLWSIACGVHYLLFGVAPYFFMEKHSDIKAYLCRYNWPACRTVRGIRLKNNHAFDYYERAYQTTPVLHGLFQQTFQHGYGTPSDRIGASQWYIAIKEQLRLLGISSPYITQLPVRPAPVPVLAKVPPLQHPPNVRPARHHPNIVAKQPVAAYRIVPLMFASFARRLPNIAVSKRLSQLAGAALVLITVFFLGLAVARKSNSIEPLDRKPHGDGKSADSSSPREPAVPASSVARRTTTPPTPSAGIDSKQSAPLNIVVFHGGQIISDGAVLEKTNIGDLGFLIEQGAETKKDSALRVEWWLDDIRASHFDIGEGQIGQAVAYDNKPLAGKYVKGGVKVSHRGGVKGDHAGATWSGEQSRADWWAGRIKRFY